MCTRHLTRLVDGHTPHCGRCLTRPPTFCATFAPIIPRGALFLLRQRITPYIGIGHLSEFDVGAIQLQLQLLGGLHELFPLLSPRICTRNGRLLWPQLTPGWPSVVCIMSYCVRFVAVASDVVAAPAPPEIGCGHDWCQNIQEK